jgi:ElaB/YqjD/DUF883 family membrane-anchored ribosome-binding protein
MFARRRLFEARKTSLSRTQRRHRRKPSPGRHAFALPVRTTTPTQETFMTAAERFDNSSDIAGRKNGSTVSDVDLQTLRDEIAHLTQQMAALLVAAGGKTRQNIDDLMTNAKARGKDAVAPLREAAEPVVKGLEEAVHSHPFAALALAVGLGLAFAAVLRR